MDASEDQFQEEVLQLFAEEGLGWIKQIRVALQELESGAMPDKEKKHYDIILRSLTNLMGSAATVELPALQKLALTLIPLLQAMQTKKVAAKPEHFATIRQGVALMFASVQVLHMASQRTTVKANLESMMQLQAEGLQRAVAKVQGIPKTAAPAPRQPVSPEATSLGKIVQALLDLKHARPSSLEPSRNLVEVVLRRLHRLSDQESAEVTAASVASILHQLEKLDERFLEDTRRQGETLKQVIAGLKGGTRDPHGQKANLQGGLREISSLYETARVVGAAPIVQFLHGLETLLLEVVYKGVALVPQRVEAVADRLDSLAAMAQQWVEMGRTEQAAIEKALAPLIDKDLART
jgi:chemotaxis protein histidine kinase CheA